MLLVSLFPCVAAALTWVRHTIPFSGTLVLTDVHAALDGVRIVALATGEQGVVLKLDAEVAPPAGTWQVLTNQGADIYWYGAYVFNASSLLLSGFVDGGGEAYGVVSFSDDGGSSWGNDTKIDPCSQSVCAWGGGPIQFATGSALEGYMPSTSGESAWRTQAGGRNASEWREVIPAKGNWHSGDYVYDGNGFIAIAGSIDCNSTDFAETWTCAAPVDTSGIDTGIACGGGICIIGGGEISPEVLGWLHVSKDGGRTYAPQRALQAPFPIRTLQVVASGAGVPTLVAAGGNFFSSVGGVFSSKDGGVSWELDIDLGEEVKACRSIAIPTLSVTRVFCVSAGARGGGIISADVPL